MLERGLQQHRHQAAGLGQRRLQGQALVGQHAPLGGLAGGQGQRLLRQVQPLQLLPHCLRVSRPLRTLLRPPPGKCPIQETKFGGKNLARNSLDNLSKQWEIFVQKPLEISNVLNRLRLKKGKKAGTLIM